MKDLLFIKSRPISEAEKAEKCFHQCVHYWLRLVKRGKHGFFKNPADEIVFFKELKPLFTSEAEYYSFLYHAALFKPLDDAFIRPFWAKELDRMEQLQNKVPCFYAYYRSGETNLDSHFFNQAHCSLDHIMIEWTSNDKKVPYDLLISQYMAIEKYRQFVSIQLQQLEKDNNVGIPIPGFGSNESDHTNRNE